MAKPLLSKLLELRYKPVTNKLEILKELIELGRTRSGNQLPDAIGEFSELIFKSVNLQSTVEKLECDSEIKLLARRNVVVNVVSALECFLKEIIKQYAGKWSHIGLNNLLKDKITLGEAFDYFKDTSISKEVIVARFTSFQNINNINRVFTELIGQDFFLELNKFAELLERSKKCSDLFLFTIASSTNWKRDLADLLIQRNEIVHEPSHNTQLTEGDIEQILGLMMCFGGTVTKYFERRFDHKK